MKLELGSDFQSDADEDAPRATRQRSKDARVAGLKTELKQALSQPVVVRGVSAKYITSDSRPVVDDLIEGDNTFVQLCACHVMLFALRSRRYVGTEEGGCGERSGEKEEEKEKDNSEEGNVRAVPCCWRREFHTTVATPDAHWRS